MLTLYPCSPADRQRFASKVATVADERGCLRWLGGKDRDGYGRFALPATISPARASIGAHRVAWELANGAIPEGLHVLHKCDNPQCVNPEHLFLGDVRSNSDDKLAKSRQARGETQGLRKLSADDVRRIRALRERDGTSYARLAAMFCVSPLTTYGACNGRTWRHV